MDNDSITDADITQAVNYETLGPAYFAARRMAEKVMQNADQQPFKDIVAKVVKDVQENLYEWVEDHLRNDLEANLQHYIANCVERTVQALLTGEEWAMKQYPLSTRWDGQLIRATVAHYGGEPLLVKRIEELEAEAVRREETIRNLSGRY